MQFYNALDSFFMSSGRDFIPVHPVALGAPKRNLWIRALTLIPISLAVSLCALASHITLDVDATDVTHGIQHAHIVLPVHPGSLTLAYPKWVPGEHAANGPITQIVNLHVAALGRELRWRRDTKDAFLFHIAVPTGAHSLAVDLDYLSPPEAFGSGFGKSPNVTPNQLVLLFNQLIVYPVQEAPSAIEVFATVKLPAGWRYDCALPLKVIGNNTVKVSRVPLSTLVIRPLLPDVISRAFILQTSQPLLD
jgi:hypothetical protein